MVDAKQPIDYTGETADLPFLNDYPTIIDDVTMSDIRGRHVIGSIPEDLEHHAESVTRYSIRQATDPSKWTWADYQNPQPQERELITYRVDPHTFSINHLDAHDMTFITSNPSQAIHWRRNGLMDHAEVVVLGSVDISP